MLCQNALWDCRGDINTNASFTGFCDVAQDKSGSKFVSLNSLKVQFGTTFTQSSKDNPQKLLISCAHSILNNRAFSLTWPASMLIYWNKRKFLHKKRIQLPQDCLGTPTWQPFHCLGTPIWPP